MAENAPIGGGGAAVGQPGVAMAVRKAALSGRLRVERVGGRTSATTVFARSPLKLILPTQVAASAVDALWVFSVTYGGGIVAGDDVSLLVEVGADCTMVLATQASTKVYRNLAGKGSQQSVEARVAPGALLALLPDPVVCFAGARFRQRTRVALAEGASLVLLDWLTSGRVGRGEAWDADTVGTEVEVSMGGRRVLLERTRLEQGGALSLAERMQGMHVAGVAVLVGPRAEAARVSIKAAADALCSARLARRGGGQAGAGAGAGAAAGGVWASASPLGSGAEGGTLVRLVGATTESVYDFLKSALAPLESDIGAVPFPDF